MIFPPYFDPLQVALARMMQRLEPDFIAIQQHGPFKCVINLAAYGNVQGEGQTKKIAEKHAVDAACHTLDRQGLLRGPPLTAQQQQLMTSAPSNSNGNQPAADAGRRGSIGGGKGSSKGQKAVRRECDQGNIPEALPLPKHCTLTTLVSRHIQNLSLFRCPVHTNVWHAGIASVAHFS